MNPNMPLSVNRSIRWDNSICNTEALFYLTTRITTSLSFPWWQPSQCSPLLQLALDRCTRA